MEQDSIQTNNPTRIAQKLLDEKIQTTEKALLNGENASKGLWIPAIISLGLVIFMAVKIPGNGLYIIITFFGLLYLGFNIWRITKSEKQKMMLRSDLDKYRDERNKIQSSQK